MLDALGAKVTYCVGRIGHVVYAKYAQSWSPAAKSPNGWQKHLSVDYVIAADVGTVECVERSIR